jgi:hypothetical protein
MPIRTVEREAEILWEKQVVMSSTRKQGQKRQRQVIARAGVLGVQVRILCTMPSSSKVLKRVQTAPTCHDVVRMMGAGVLMKSNVVSLKMEPALGVCTDQNVASINCANALKPPGERAAR